jgi:hypothetical protein
MSPHPYIDALVGRGQEAASNAKSNALQSLKLALEDLPVRTGKLVDPAAPKSKPSADDVKAARDQAAKKRFGDYCEDRRQRAS